jgi:hypothetical protein
MGSIYISRRLSNTFLSVTGGFKQTSAQLIGKGIQKWHLMSGAMKK